MSRMPSRAEYQRRWIHLQVQLMLTQEALAAFRDLPLKGFLYFWDKDEDVCGDEQEDRQGVPLPLEYHQHPVAQVYGPAIVAISAARIDGRLRISRLIRRWLHKGNPPAGDQSIFSGTEMTSPSCTVQRLALSPDIN